MRGSLRPADLLVLLTLVALLAVFAGVEASDSRPLPLPGPLTVTQATALFTDEPLVVRGYLVRRPGSTLLCEAPACGGARLVVRGDAVTSASHRSVLLVGTISGERIVPFRLARRAQQAAL